MFNLGTGHFREQGIENQLYYKWIGVGYDEGSSLLSMTVLTPGQVVMAFTFILSIYMFMLYLIHFEPDIVVPRYTSPYKTYDEV